jgi:hypothetical protein
VTPSVLPPLGDLSVLECTRLSWHAVAEQVMAPARHQAAGRIGLRATPGGFGTPPFEREGEEHELRVVRRELVVRRGAAEQSIPLTTIAAAAEAVGIEPGAPADVYTPTTDLPADSSLDIDDAAADALAAWFDSAWSALEDLRRESTRDDAASEVQLWPEHFDVAMETGDEARSARGTYGASPGDSNHSEPYLYVELWSEPTDDPFWNDAAFRGASLGYSAVRDADDAGATIRGFFARGRELLTRPG